MQVLFLAWVPVQHRLVVLVFITAKNTLHTDSVDSSGKSARNGRGKVEFRGQNNDEGSFGDERTQR